MTQTLRRSYIFFIVGLLMLLAVLNLADKELLAAVAPVVKTDLNLDDGHLGLIRSTVFLAAIIGAFIWGPLSDRWKRKNVLALGATCWSLVTWLTVYARGFFSLAAARAGVSFFEACFGPSAYSLVTDVVPRKRRGIVIGLLGITYPLGTILALLVGGLVGETNWRLPFLYFGIPGIILGLLVLLFVREPGRGATEDAVLEMGGAYTGRFSLAELKRALRTRTLLLIFLLDACEASVFYSLSFWAPNYLLSYKIAPDLGSADLALLPAILGSVCGSLLGGFLTDRLRLRTPKAATWVSLAAMSGGFIIALILFNVFSLSAIMIAAFFFGLVGYMIFPSITVMMYDIVPPETKATVMASDGVISGLINIAAAAGIGLFSRQFQNLRIAFGGATLLFLAAGTILAWIISQNIVKDMHDQEELIKARVTANPEI
jgi:MFS family permease